MLRLLSKPTAIAGTAALAFLAAVCAPARGQTVVVGSFSGHQQGALCGTSATNSDTLESFQETTQTTNVGDASRQGPSTFKLELASLCAAPFFKAFSSHEVVSAEFKYVDPQTHNAVLTLSMPGMRLEKIELSASADSGMTSPVLGLEFSTGNVVWGGPTSASDQSSSKPTSASNQRSSKPTDKSVERPRAPTILRNLAAHHRAQSGPAAAWTQSGVAGANVQFSGGTPVVTATFALRNFHFSCDLRLAGHGPIGNWITLRDLEKPVDASTATMKSLIAQGSIPSASFTIVNKAGTPGITIAFPRLEVTSDDLNTNQEKIRVRVLSAPTLTDIISGTNTIGGCQ